MTNSTQGSTLLATERRLRPLVLALVWGCALLATMALVSAFPYAPRILWIVCALVTVACWQSNLHYRLTHPQPTVGMIPVALISLLVATLPGAFAAGAPSSVRTPCLVGAIVLGAISVPFVVVVFRILTTCLATRDIASDAALIVLGGAVRDGQPSPTLRYRLDTARRVWTESPERLIVVTGGPVPGNLTTEADVMASYLQRNGVNPRQIIIERTARNTQENIAFSAALLDERGHASQRCIVSSNYHLWRAQRDARQMGQDLVGIPAPISPASIPQQWSREALTILSRR